MPDMMPKKRTDIFRESRLFDLYKRLAAVPDHYWWRLRGSPGVKVSHLVKQRAIREYAKKFNLQTLVETGTNLGQMINAMKGTFREIYSVELDDWRCEMARRKFARHPHVHVLHGDSGVVLRELVPKLTGPCLFWLDGHCWDITSPVKAELDAIFSHPEADHVLLIDDARWFDGRTEYPTLEELREQVAQRYPGRVVEVRDDIIRIHRPQS